MIYLKNFESLNYDPIYEIDENIKFRLLELEDLGFTCRVNTTNNRIIITISNGCTTGFNQFLFKHIQPVCLTIIRYVLANGNWQVRIARAIDHGTRIEIVEKLSFDNIVNKLNTEEEDISGGIYSNEFRIMFVR